MTLPPEFATREDFWQEIGTPVLVILGLHIPELLILLVLLFYLFGFCQSDAQLPAPTGALQ